MTEKVHEHVNSPPRDTCILQGILYQRDELAMLLSKPIFLSVPRKTREKPYVSQNVHSDGFLSMSRLDEFFGDVCEYCWLCQWMSGWAWNLTYEKQGFSHILS